MATTLQPENIAARERADKQRTPKKDYGNGFAKCDDIRKSGANPGNGSKARIPAVAADAGQDIVWGGVT